MHKFSDFADEKPLDGDKMKLEEILNCEVIIKEYKVTNSKYNKNKLLTIQVEINEANRVIFTGSEVLLNQLEKYKTNLPFIASINKIGNYYTLK